MFEIVKFTEPQAGEICLNQCGLQQCEPGYSYGPAVRDYHVIHYILSGKGSFQVGGETYALLKHQGFLISPGVQTYYKADIAEPWTYFWVGFNGTKADEFLSLASLYPKNPVFTYDKDSLLEQCFRDIISVGASAVEKSEEIQVQHVLYKFFSLLIGNAGKAVGRRTGKKESYVEEVIDYIEKNYARKLGIHEIARYIGLDRSYLGTIFKEFTGLTPQDYLIQFRLKKSCELMKDSRLSIGDVARAVGYDDPLLFSKTFKKQKQLSPRHFRKNMSKL